VKGARGGSDDFQTIIDTSIVKQFRSHFIRTFQDLASLNPRWVHSVYFDGDPRIDAQASTLADEWNAAEHEAVVQAMPTTPTFLRTRIHHNLNLDLARTAVLGTHLAPDGLHFPLLALKASGGEVKVGGSGQRPLLLAMPELSHASWEDVCDLRKWRGFQRLRAKMRELDGPELRDKDIQARLTAEYLAEVEKRRPRWAGTAVAGISFFLGFVPVLGQIVSGALAAQNAVTAARGSQHWTATLVRAKKRLAAPGTRLASS
jgi:hypothetical protein